MPELPEVETVARGLREQIVGRKIVSVTLRKTDFIDDAEAVERNLPGRLIAAVERFGKFLLLRLVTVRDGSALTLDEADGEPASLMVHLGMTGQIGPSAAAVPWEKHTHVGFLLDDGRELRYSDPRRFGRMAYLTAELLAKEVARAGADPLEVSAPEFARLIRGRSARIKALLLDQGVLRGVGNIYADESLWKAKIHPAGIAAKLTGRESELLRKGLKEILQKAIVLRGSSISNFVDAKGVPGEYQRRHKAYGREGEACRRCRATIRRGIVAGRSSFYCPTCQKPPRGFEPLPLPVKMQRLGRERAGLPKRKRNRKRTPRVYRNK